MYCVYSETTLQIRKAFVVKIRPTDVKHLDQTLGLSNKNESQLKLKLWSKDVNSQEWDTRKITKKDHRFKTEKCRQFYELGQCEYGDRCKFAHGLNELVGKPRGSLYKTRECLTFNNEGYCSFGSRCAFVHTQVDDPVKWIESAVSQCPRVPMPENLSSHSRPEFYPANILMKRCEPEMLRENHLLPFGEYDSTSRLKTFKRITARSSTSVPLFRR